MTGAAADEPYDPGRWVAAGFSEPDVMIWRRWRIALETAVAWRHAGVTDGLQAAQWSVARVTPTTVGDWRSAGLTATDAVRAHELGFDLAAAREFKRRGLTPEQAYAQRHSASGRTGLTTRSVGGGIIARFHELKVPPQVMHTYLSLQWLDEQALAWARCHVPAAIAQQWRDLGLVPDEGARLTRAGRTPGDVIREWWRAGIPYDEVADWLGAGLTAQEAVEQRARGITVAQAAALRALRRGGGPDPE